MTSSQTWGKLTYLKYQAAPLSANGIVYVEIAELSKLAQQISSERRSQVQP